MLSDWTKNSFISRIYKISKEGNSIGNNSIVYTIKVQTYVSGKIEKAYIDRRKAHYFKFVLQIYNKIQHSGKTETKLDISTIYQKSYHNVL